jgi:hypothetical protein
MRLLAVLLVICSCTVTASGSNFVVAGYLPEYRLGSVDDWKPGERLDRVAERLTDLILFSVQPTAKGGLDKGAIPADHLAAAVAAKRRHGTRVLVSVGGAGRSGSFPQVTSTKSSRAKFLAELSAFLAEAQLDGVDYDWEGPGSQAEMLNYVELLVESRAALPESLISVALHPGQMLNAPAYAAVDRVHLMAYDFNGGEQVGLSGWVLSVGGRVGCAMLLAALVNRATLGLRAVRQTLTPP